MDKIRRERLIIANMPLIYKLVRKYSNMLESYGYDKEDCEQEATIALIKSVDTYDESNNIKFSTYAYISIENHLKELIRWNGSARRKIKRYTTSMNETINSSDEDLTIEDVIGVDVDYLDNVLKFEILDRLEKRFDKRDLKILELRANGYDLPTIGKIMQISKQRVSAIINNMSLFLDRNRESLQRESIKTNGRLIAYNKENGYEKVFESVEEASSVLGCDFNTIRKICQYKENPNRFKQSYNTTKSKSLDLRLSFAWA